MTKYNATKVTIDNHTFDSKEEARFYMYLKTKQEAGEVTSIELQPRYLLQPKFTQRGKTYRRIDYIADFLVTLKNGEQIVYDVKGYMTPVFMLKQKLFKFKYPELDLRLIKHVKKFGGWITHEEYTKRKRAEKKVVK